MGNCIGWSSPSLPLMMSSEFFLDVTESEASVVTSVLALGGMCGPVLAGCLIDVVGRKYTLVIDQILMLSSWVILFFAWRIEMIYLARFIAGVAVAVIFSAAPLYIAEVTEPKLRGLLSAITLPTRCASMLFAYIVGPFVSFYHLIILSAVAPLLFLALSPCMRESPYFFVSKGQNDKAKESLSWIRGGISEDICAKEIDSIQSVLGLYFFLTERNINGPIINWLPVVSVLTYMFLFNFAFTNLPWVIMGEVFPPNIKAHAASLCTAVYFFFGYITAQCFPLLVHLFGNDYAFWFHASFCFISVIYIYYFVPETKGLSLQEIQQLIGLSDKKTSTVVTRNNDSKSLSKPMTDTAIIRNPSKAMTITVNGKSLSKNTASTTLNGTYMLRESADFICHV